MITNQSKTLTLGGFLYWHPKASKLLLGMTAVYNIVFHVCFYFFFFFFARVAILLRLLLFAKFLMAIFKNRHLALNSTVELLIDFDN